MTDAVTRAEHGEEHVPAAFGQMRLAELGLARNAVEEVVAQLAVRAAASVVVTEIVESSTEAGRDLVGECRGRCQEPEIRIVSDPVHDLQAVELRLWPRAMRHVITADRRPASFIVDQKGCCA